MRAALFALMPLMMACSSETVQAMESPSEEFQRTLSVSGTGTSTATPDLAVLTFGVQAQGETAGDALAANSKQMNAVVTAVKKMGVEAKDIQTSNFSLSPMYQRRAVSGVQTNVIVGYETFNTLTIRLRETERVGSAIDTVIGAGANNFNNLSFSFQDTSELAMDARRNAVKNARAVAEVMAEEAGVKLGPVLTMSESSSRPQVKTMARAMVAEAAMAPTPIEAGESEVSVTVHMTFGLK